MILGWLERLGCLGLTGVGEVSEWWGGEASVGMGEFGGVEMTVGFFGGSTGSSSIRLIVVVGLD